jgi:hypothetical protein
VLRGQLIDARAERFRVQPVPYANKPFAQLSFAVIELCESAGPNWR